MITQEKLKALRQALPKDWVSRVMAKTGFKATKIREVLRSPGIEDADVMNAIIEVGKDYKTEKAIEAQTQEAAIDEILS